ncbi:MAG: HlyD family efflux transporter periplasmic adaptor subunit [Lachnospiraceae bacterium]
MAKDNKIVKFRTRREVNIGLVVAFGVLIILILNIYRYFTTPHLSVYEVQAGSAGSESKAVAMILRAETVYRTDQAGYLNYYYREGARIAKGAKVYSLNDSSDLQNLLTMNEENSMLTENDLGRLKSDVRAFCAKYSDAAFSESYKLREDFLSDYLRYRDVSMLDAITEGSVTTVGGLRTVYAPESGSVTYYSDLYDGYTVERITGEEFLQENRTVPERSKPTGLSAIDSFAYKLVTDDNWQLVISLDEDSFRRLQTGGDTVTFRISGDSALYRKPYETLFINGGHYLLVEMERYVTDYFSERFLDITLSFNAEEGLKIPGTSIVEKEVYQIPERFVMAGGMGDEDSVGVSVECFDEASGEVKPDYRPISPLFFEDGYYYVAAEALDSGSYINSSGLTAEPERAMLYSFLTNLEGVYNMNQGYAVFKRIERITDLEDYILVRSGLAGGVALYDHIVLDVSAVTKDVILIEGE